MNYINLKRSLFFFAALFAVGIMLTAGVFAEEKSPGWTHIGEITNMVKDSDLFEYHTTYFDPKVETKKYYESLGKSDPAQVLETVDGKTTVKKYEASKEVTELINKALEEKKKEKYEKALKLLNDALKKDPNFSLINTEIGGIYIADKKYKEALPYLEKAVAINPIDFTAHRYQGDCYRALKEPKKSLNAYINALICARNDEETWKNLEALGKEEGFTLYREPFIPLYRITKLETGKIRIYIDIDQMVRWMPYSFNHAVWMHEPGFFEKKTGEKEYRFTEREGYEAVRAMIWTYETMRLRGNINEDPMEERLRKIQERFFIKEFVLFEMMSPENPQILPEIEKKRRADLVDYIKEFVIVKDKD